MADTYIFDYGEGESLFGDSLDIIIPVGDNLGDLYLPKINIFGYGSTEDIIVGDIVISQPYILASVGYTISLEGNFVLPNVEVSAGSMLNMYELPGISVSGYTGATTDVDNYLPSDLESGYNLPQLSVASTCALYYSYGDVELPQLSINIVDVDYDGVPDDLVWVDTDGDGEPDTQFYDPIFVDTDGDGIPDTWIENWYQGDIPLFGIGRYNLRQVSITGSGNATYIYNLPQIVISGTAEVEQIMDINIDVPLPEVAGIFVSSKYFSGDINAPLPVVAGTLQATTYFIGGINVPLPKVVGTFQTGVFDLAIDINIPKPIVSISFASDVETDSPMTFGDTPQCTQ